MTPTTPSFTPTGATPPESGAQATSSLDATVSQLAENALKAEREFWINKEVQKGAKEDVAAARFDAFS